VSDLTAPDAAPINPTVIRKILIPQLTFYDLFAAPGKP